MLRKLFTLCYNIELRLYRKVQVVNISFFSDSGYVNIHITIIIALDRRSDAINLLNYLLSDRRSECKLGKIDSVR